jgi:8-oxo-dGTP diphosphatase
MKLGVISLAFLCQVTGGQEHETSEASRVAWLSPTEAVAAMPEARAVRVTDALSDEGPFVRVHDGDVILSASG